jgi:hypothetical protein
MRILAIAEAPVLTASRSRETAEGKSGRPGFLTSATTIDYQQQQQQQRLRSSSIPKPIQTRVSGFQGSSALPFQSSPTPLSIDQIPTFSNPQASVSILTAILAREPELRDRVLKETLANDLAGGQYTDDRDENCWNYSEWIGYLYELLQMCGIGLARDSYVGQPCGGRLPAQKIPAKLPSVASGFSFLSNNPPAAQSGVSLFSVENIKQRRHTAAAALSTAPGPAGQGIKYEVGEDREVIFFLVKMAFPCVKCSSRVCNFQLIANHRCHTS